VSKLFRIISSLVIVSLLLFLNPWRVQAQTTGSTSKYFNETKHNVQGDFWKFYQAQPNGQQVFGFPITEQYIDPKSGRLIQYFSRARFEYYPEKPDGQRVVLTALGKYVYKKGPAVNIFTPVGCRTFASGFNVCYAFLDFFDKNGGETIFGQPISSFEIYNERIVQYFERARFEWYPELPEGQKVVLAELGRIYFDSVPEDRKLLDVVPPLNSGIVPSNSGPLSIQARAFAWKAVVLPQESQAIYVIVQDQTLTPVQNATVVVDVVWGEGDVESSSLPTGQNGVVIVPLTVRDRPYGSLVTVNIRAYFNGLEARTITSFRIWR
jgi:hypothetical protein